MKFEFSEKDTPHRPETGTPLFCCLDNTSTPAKHLFKVLNQGVDDIFKGDGPMENPRHGGHWAVLDSAGDDGGEEREVRIDVQGKAV